MRIAEFNNTKVTFSDKEGICAIFEVSNNEFDKELQEVEEMLSMEEPDCEDLAADEEIDEL